MTGKVDWSAAGKTEELERLFAEGLAPRQIAEAMGVTKNVIIGRAHRIGLSWVERDAALRKSEPKPKKLKPKQPFRLGPDPRRVRLPPEFITPTVVDTPPLGIPFYQLRRSQCKWFVDEGGYQAPCCGHPVKAGSAYCLSHHRVVYVPPPKRP